MNPNCCGSSKFDGEHTFARTLQINQIWFWCTKKAADAPVIKTRFIEIKPREFPGWKVRMTILVNCLRKNTDWWCYGFGSHVRSPIKRQKCMVFLRAAPMWYKCNVGGGVGRHWGSSKTFSVPLNLRLFFHLSGHVTGAADLKLAVLPTFATAF